MGFGSRPHFDDEDRLLLFFIDADLVRETAKFAQRLAASGQVRNQLVALPGPAPSETTLAKVTMRIVGTRPVGSA